MRKSSLNTSNRLKDENAPKMPMNAYSRYFKASTINIKREGQSTKEISSKLAKQWALMSEEEKKPYYDEYNKERDAYYEKLKEYKETDQYKDFQKKKSDKKKQSRLNRLSTNANSEENSDFLNVKFPKNIQIFSQEFLEYNKKQENLLKTLRKQRNIISNECKQISEQCDSTSEHLEHLNEVVVQKQNYCDQMDLLERKTNEEILDVLEKTNLLDSLKIEKQTVTLGEIVAKFEEISKSPTKNTKILTDVREALHKVKFDFSELLF